MAPKVRVRVRARVRARARARVRARVTVARPAPGEGELVQGEVGKVLLGLDLLRFRVKVRRVLRRCREMRGDMGRYWPRPRWRCRAPCST